MAKAIDVEIDPARDYVESVKEITQVLRDGTMKIGPFLELSQQAYSVGLSTWELVEEDAKAIQELPPETKALVLTVIKRWTLHKIWGQAPPDTSFKIHIGRDAAFKE